MYDELKANLQSVIWRESEKPVHFTGELRVDWMAKDCLDAIESLTTQLAEAKAERDAAVEDIKIACTVGEPCFICKHGCNNGDQFPCSVSDDWCKGEKWKYRGRKSNG